jgi:hypothetical protein
MALRPEAKATRVFFLASRIEKAPHAPRVWALAQLRPQNHTAPTSRRLILPWVSPGAGERAGGGWQWLPKPKPHATPPGPRKRGVDDGHPLARQSRMKSTTPWRCNLPMYSSNARTTRGPG